MSFRFVRKIAAMAVLTTALNIVRGQDSRDDELVQIGPGVTAPRLISKVEPRYTAEGRKPVYRDPFCWTLW